MDQDKELVDVLDESGNLVHTVLKDQTHQDGSLHAVVIGVVIHPNGNRMVIRQTSDRQDAGQYVNPVGGHVRAGEALEDAMRREAHEELGWKTITLNKIGAAVFNRTVIGRKENHLFHVYRIWSDEPVALNEESVEYTGFSPSEYKNMMQKTPHFFGDAHHFVETAFADYFV